MHSYYEYASMQTSCNDPLLSDGFVISDDEKAILAPKLLFGSNTSNYYTHSSGPLTMELSKLSIISY